MTYRLGKIGLVGNIVVKPPLGGDGERLPIRQNRTCWKLQLMIHWIKEPWYLPIRQNRTCWKPPKVTWTYSEGGSGLPIRQNRTCWKHPGPSDHFAIFSLPIRQNRTCWKPFLLHQSRETDPYRLGKIGLVGNDFFFSRVDKL